MKVYNSENMRKDLVGKVRNIRIYGGDAKNDLENSTSTVARTEQIKIVSESWKNSAGREKLLNERKALSEKVRLMNASTGYDWKTIQALAGLYTIDMVRQADDFADYTPVVFKEVVDEKAPEIVTLRNMMPYIGKEETVTGSGDTVPLIQSALPVDDNVQLEIRGFGDRTTLRQLIFNPFHKTEMITESAARILSDEKNKDFFGPLMGATFGAAHKQAADTAGATYDLQLYNTLKKAIWKAVNLKCKPVGKENGLLRHEVFLLVNPMDLINIQPVANGALAGVGGIQQIASALPIDGIIPYGGGLNHGLMYGSEELYYPGVPQGKAYAFIKVDVFGGYRITKRSETMEVGEGDVLALSQEKRAWHRVRGVHNGFVLPKVENGKNYGAVVEITLPVFG